MRSPALDYLFPPFISSFATHKMDVQGRVLWGNACHLWCIKNTVFITLVKLDLPLLLTAHTSPSVTKYTYAKAFTHKRCTFVSHVGGVCFNSFTNV